MSSFENTVILGSCLEVLKGLPDNTFHSIVMDPPYGLGTKEPTVEEISAYLQGADLDTGGDFMGKKWEIPSVLVWHELFRVLRPGGHLLTFGGTRTWDLISLGARAAGFEYRDTIPDIFPDLPGLMWMYGQGFPKSLNVSKAIDKDLGVEREVIGTYRVSGNALTPTSVKGGTYVTGAPNSPAGDLEITKAGSEEAAQWEGWGTALKPSWEPILMYRKPLDGTVLNNIRKWGCGAINIDGTRVFTDWDEPDRPESWKASGHTAKPDAEKIAAPPGHGITTHPGGRWPPNVLLAHTGSCDAEGLNCVEGCPVKALDKQTGELKTNPGQVTSKMSSMGYHGGSGSARQVVADSGGASRFFPQFTPFLYEGKVTKKEATLDGEIENDHPTKKPIALMQWLVKLVTPKGGIVLDPYCGSGSTLHAAELEGVRWTGIERDEDSHKTATERMKIVFQKEQEFRGQRNAFGLAMSLGDDDFDPNMSLPKDDES